jgi:hypothetical protein
MFQGIQADNVHMSFALRDTDATPRSDHRTMFEAGRIHAERTYHQSSARARTAASCRFAAPISTFGRDRRIGLCGANLRAAMLKCRWNISRLPRWTGTCGQNSVAFSIVATPGQLGAVDPAVSLTVRPESIQHSAAAPDRRLARPDHGRDQFEMSRRTGDVVCMECSVTRPSGSPLTKPPALFTLAHMNNP